MISANQRSFYYNGSAWSLIDVDNHVHSGADITSGQIDFARLPTGVVGDSLLSANLFQNKGDLLVGITGQVVSNFPLGASGTFLKANSSVTAGIEWSGLGSITASGLTQSTARILGRTSSGSGAIEEISIGAGLSLTAGALSATASGGGTKTYSVFTARDNQPTATAFATLDSRNSIAILDFDDASTESAVFVSIMPEAAVLGSGLTVFLDWMATTATSGNVRWSISFERCNTDLDTDSFDTAVAATATTAGTSGVPTFTSITITTIDGITAGDLFRIRVQRLGGDGADTMTGDAELIAVEVRSAA